MFSALSIGACLHVCMRAYSGIGILRPAGCQLLVLTRFLAVFLERLEGYPACKNQSLFRPKILYGY